MNRNPDFLMVLGKDKNDPGRVTVALTLALAALTQKKKTTLLLMVEGVRVAQKGHVDDIDVGEPFSPAADVLESFIAAGGEIVACGACLKHNGVPTDSLLPETQVVDGSGAVELASGASKSLHFT